MHTPWSGMKRNNLMSMKHLTPWLPLVYLYAQYVHLCKCYLIIIKYYKNKVRN